jgi:hypothetical protein
MTKGWPIDVTFEYASNGRLSVRAVVPGTGHEAKLDIERAKGISNDGIEKWKKTVGAAAGFDSFETMVQNLLGIDAPISPLPLDEEPRVRAELGEAEPTIEAHENIQGTISPFAPSDTLIPQRKPGSSALRTFAAEPPATAAASAGFVEDEDIPTGETVEFIPQNQVGKPSRPAMSVSRLLLNVIGFSVFSAGGLAIAYVLLHYLKPETFKWPW